MIKLSQICNGEDALVQEIKDIVNSGKNLPQAYREGISSSVIKSVIDNFKISDNDPVAEAVIKPYMRPVLYVKNGKVSLPVSDELIKRIVKYRGVIEKQLPAVGRIELKNSNYESIGTGWLVADDTIVTNRHVAEVFATQAAKNKGVFIQTFTGKTLMPFIDFKEEINQDKSIEIEIKSVLFMPSKGNKIPDLTILKIKPNNKTPDPVPFYDRLTKDQFIGVIGYPMSDPRGVKNKAMEKDIFGEVLGVKRYAPGQVITVPKSQHYFLHDASTLGGNSGSLVQDMESGCAVGIHFGGILMEANYAVKGSVILEKCKSCNIHPIKFTKSQVQSIIVDHDSIQEKSFAESSYNDRVGYDVNFLSSDSTNAKVNLPKVKSTNDILKFGKNNKETELKYTHFSVVMSKSRRLCYYSAVNIDGATYKRMKRPSGWRYDSRIPKEAQIMKECYGVEPRFSKGHMARREDPNWGPLAAMGNKDSMHVTNAAPQMQSFNAGTWLSLENYALENAKHDDQKISVITGPVLSDNDPTIFDVQIPVEFWKVIAFIHDDTGKLCVTGYTQSQEGYLRNDEFVFGQFETYQVPLKLIEKKAGINFGTLKKLDPLADAIFESIPSPIKSVRQIRFF